MTMTLESRVAELERQVAELNRVNEARLEATGGFLPVGSQAGLVNASPSKPAPPPPPELVQAEAELQAAEAAYWKFMQELAEETPGAEDRFWMSEAGRQPVKYERAALTIPPARKGQEQRLHEDWTAALVKRNELLGMQVPNIEVEVRRSENYIRAGWGAL